MSHPIQVAVIGGGPAGLRAAEVAAATGAMVRLFDAKRSVGRKFLIAGKGGLNLTHGESPGVFAGRYQGPGQPPDVWKELLEGFGPADLRSWASDLGIATFEAGSGRVYPKEMKAAPLLRRWIARLRSLGVEFRMNHRYQSLTPGAPHVIRFDSGAVVEADAVVFALGGGSWPQTGSDGLWPRGFRAMGIACNPLLPANCGWEHPWPASVLSAAEGMPVKNIVASAGGIRARGELLITRYGLEGGAIYQLGAVLRQLKHPAIALDFKPTFTQEQLVAKMESVRRRFLDEARTRWKLGAAARALLATRPWHDAESLARGVKHFVIPLTGPRPIEEAISSAGGVCWEELDGNLMLRKIPGVYVAGEMIDWEAPTGGYLMQGCFATGTRAGRAAAGHPQGR